MNFFEHHRLNLCGILLLPTLLLAFSGFGTPTVNAQGGLGGFLKNAIQEAVPGRKMEVIEQNFGDLPAYDGPKHKIAVGEVSVAPRPYGTMANGIRETLQSVLFQSGYFQVLDRTKWSADNGEVESVNFDDIERADFVVNANVSAIDLTSRSGLGAVLPLPGALEKLPFGKRRGGGIGIDTAGKTATMRITMTVTKARSSKILYSREFVVKSGSSSLSIKKYGLGGLGSEADNPVNQAAMEAVYEMVRSCCDYLASQPAALASELALDAEVVDVDTVENCLFINLGTKHGIKKNMKFYAVDKRGFTRRGFSASVYEAMDSEAKLVVEEGELPPVGSKLVCRK